MKILHNRNLNELTEETDLLGLRNKSKAIQFFIENLIEENNVQMIALYGEWGSGKTSIMKDIEKNLKIEKKNNFHSIFFEVWKHEKDDNIALSLLSCLTNDLIRDKVVNDAFNSAIDLFKSIGTGLSFDFSIGDFLGANKAGVKISLKDMMDSYKKFQNERYNQSFLNIQEKFKKQIGLLEHKILEKNKIKPTEGKIVVFLDDLDRCEPDVVLNLLAAIKLFYTYGKRLIFVCGVDKLAVQNAVRTKYDEIIKSEEYLEKIFDASFQVPSVNSYDKLLTFYFEDAEVNEKLVVEELSSFFKAINFNRPRHLKKVLNKYATLVEFKHQENLPKDLKELIPNIIDENGNGNYTETYLTIYFIILNEFFPQLFEKIDDENGKLLSMTNIFHKSRPPKSTVIPYSDSLNSIKSQVFHNNFHDKGLNEIKIGLASILNSNNQNSNAKNKIRNQFVTILLSEITSDSFTFDTSPGMYIQQFYSIDNKITTDFNIFLLKYLNILLNEEWSEYHFKNFFKMIRDLL